MNTTPAKEGIRLRQKWQNVAAWQPILTWTGAGIIAMLTAAMIVPWLIGALLTSGIMSRTQPAVILFFGGLGMYGIMLGVFKLVTKLFQQPSLVRVGGLQRLMTWKDIAFALAGAIGYVSLLFVMMYIAQHVPGFNATEPQINGDINAYGFARVAIFLTLVVVAPFLEEFIYRGVLYGQMRRSTLPWFIPACIVSILFGIAHWQWNVGVDVFCLSMVACGLRELTGSLWAGLIVHMLKNFIAFTVLFHLVGGF